MKSTNSNEIKRGQAISFRVPSDIPDHLLKHLQKLKEVERRNFSSKIAEFVLRGVGQSFSKERETITLPLPHNLSKSQRDWLKHEHSEALLGTIVYQLLTDPVRATSLLASLTSNSLDINEALYLQEVLPNEEDSSMEEEFVAGDYLQAIEETAVSEESDKMDDLDSFEWDRATQDFSIAEEEAQVEEENDLDNLLGDFLNAMNK
ncbi:hypothetical protein [Robertmurraya kyonggiensis]|uniref:Uncharacterized protein n=1 Tax=Robertmurraya kyonggiensis TaxID=1037680 RepID=A0A4U1D6M8_9BACI|nr:hypothetical protein [Robertmurraya kyonggiensis]TKC16736.1 hypothetical protein FA727_11730 [Robertmurraya kyonggiensis]